MGKERLTIDQHTADKSPFPHQCKLTHIFSVSDIDHDFASDLKSKTEDKTILMMFRCYWDADSDFCLTFTMQAYTSAANAFLS
jgi:hypothetical protein